MLDLLQPENEMFQWKDLHNVKESRSNLGEKIPVIVYRLFQYTLKDSMLSELGKEKTLVILRKAGFLAGTEFAKNNLNITAGMDEFVSELQEKLEEFEIGILRIESADQETGKFVITIAEDADCSGLPMSGQTVCHYDEGFLSGILSLYTDKIYDFIEVDCWATGATVCRFEGNVK